MHVDGVWWTAILLLSNSSVSCAFAGGCGAPWNAMPATLFLTLFLSFECTCARGVPGRRFLAPQRESETDRRTEFCSCEPFFGPSSLMSKCSSSGSEFATGGCRRCH